MVDKTLNLLLDTIQNVNSETKEKKKNEAEKLKNRLEELLKQKDNIDPHQFVNLIKEAKILNQVADFAEKLADNEEKNKDNKKNQEKIKAALLEELGIPSEFLEQLGLLKSAGVEALREAAVVYRKEAKRNLDKAELLRLEKEKIDTEIQNLNDWIERSTKSEHREKSSSQELIAKRLYQESLRDKADEELKQMLKQLEGDNSVGH